MIIENDVFKAIVETSIDAVIMIDRHGDIVFWNHSAENMFGYNVQEVLAKNLHDILPPRHQRKKANEAFQQFRQRGSSSLSNTLIQTKALTKSNQLIDVLFYFNTIALGPETFTYAFLRDVSSLVALQEKCERISNELLNEKDRLLDASMPIWTHSAIGESKIEPTPIIRINDTSTNNDEDQTDSWEHLEQSIEGLHLQDGLNTFNGDWQVYRSLLQKFTESQSDFSIRFRQILESNDSHKAIYSAHALAGTAGNLQIISVYNQAKELEQACINNANQSTILTHLVQLEETLNALLPKLTSLINMDAEPNAPVKETQHQLTREEVLSYLTTILSRCYQSDSEALTLIELLLKESSHYEDEIKAIKTLLEEFDFDQSATRLNDLINSLQ